MSSTAIKLNQQLENLCKRLGHKFSHPDLLQTALTHRSAGSDNNERLEFLGDALLNCVIAAELFKARPDLAEGDLSRMRASLVRESTLAEVAKELDLAESILLGPGESGSQRRASVLADTFEAILGAIYMDAGFSGVEKVIKTRFKNRLLNLPDPESLKDPKTRLQEYLQSRAMDVPTYQIVKSSGPAHQKRFIVSCKVGEKGWSSSAEGASRRKAEQAAAMAVLEKYVNG